MIIGLTGQTGAGKSTVCHILSEMGFAIIDCDIVAREVTVNNKKLLENLASAFGIDILNADGSLNRKALAQKAFSSPQKTALLNSIIHPVILEEIEGRIKACDNKYVILDAPTLFESGADSLCDKIIAVIADEKIRLERILKRDDITQDQAQMRISAQGDDAFYIDKSDAVIYNNGSIEDVVLQIENAKKSIGV